MCIFHKWGKWEQIENGEISKYSHSFKEEIVTGKYIVQQRECEKCNKKELIKVEV